MSRARFTPGLVAALGALLVGLAVGEQLFFLLAIVPLGYVFVGAVSGVSEPDIAIHRAVSPREPAPGESVTVTLTIENTGEAPIVDLRVADHPPSGVPVTGQTELATALAAGETATLRYQLSLPRGRFRFDPPALRVRGIAGTTTIDSEPSLSGAAAVTCQTLLDAVPLPDHTIQWVGRTPTDVGGAGVEFFATREYRHGDPVNRIDWHRYARTGALSTVEYKEEHAITVVFLLDDRPDVQRGLAGYGPDTLDLGTYAVSRALPTLLDENHRVGVARYTALSSDTGYVAPGSGPAVEAGVESTLDAAQAAGEPARVEPDGGTDSDASWGDVLDAGVLEQFTSRLPTRAQVVWCTPAVDDAGHDLADVLHQHGHRLTVLSPDMGSATSDATVPLAIAGIDRRNRLERLQQRDVPVVDWALDEPLAVALARVFDSWGRSL